jgi:hypothetical protein
MPALFMPVIMACPLMHMQEVLQRVSPELALSGEAAAVLQAALEQEGLGALARGLRGAAAHGAGRQHLLAADMA